jgi:acetyl esterase/lipase
MKTPAFFILLCVLCGENLRAQTEAPSSANSDRFKQFLKSNPASDLDKDGILTRDELSKFNAERRKNKPDRPQRKSSNRPEPTHANFKYGEHEKQVFDIWLAEPKDGKPTPLAIYIHGGGFRGGDKGDGNGSGAPIQRYLDAGISFASMNYRLSEGGANPYPIAMHDSARGLQTIRSKTEEWNIDPTKAACFGGSAGAGISLWLAFHDDLADPDSDDPIARQSTRTLAAATSAGQSTYDMRTFRKWFGVPNLKPHGALVTFYAVESEADWESDRVKGLMKDASPITHLDKSDKVAVYMTYGGTNTPVDENTSAGAWVHHVLLGLKLQEAMTELGLECTVSDRETKSEKYPNQHDFIIEQLK